MHDRKVNVGTVGHIDYGANHYGETVTYTTEGGRPNSVSSSPSIKPYDYKEKQRRKRKRAAQSRKRNRRRKK